MEIYAFSGVLGRILVGFWLYGGVEAEGLLMAGRGHKASVRMSSMIQHCCEKVRSNIENTCDQHLDRFECPDCLIHYSEASDSYGPMIHDGGSSVIAISYCPWCSSKLPNGLD